MESPDRDFTFLHDSSCRIRRSKNVCNVLKKIEFESLHYAEETSGVKVKEREILFCCMHVGGRPLPNDYERFSDSTLKIYRTTYSH